MADSGSWPDGWLNIGDIRVGVDGVTPRGLVESFTIDLSEESAERLRQSKDVPVLDGLGRRIGTCSNFQVDEDSVGCDIKFDLTPEGLAYWELNR